MNNKLIDLNNHLFAEMERLGDEELVVKTSEAKRRSSRKNAVSRKEMTGKELLEKILQAVENEKGDPSTTDDKGIVWNWNQCIEVIKEIIQPQTNGGWIPVAEQMPERDGLYLVSISQQFTCNPEIQVDKVWYSKDSNSFMDYGDLIQAWQPMPEPYHPPQEEKESAAGQEWKAHIGRRFNQVN